MVCDGFDKAIAERSSRGPELMSAEAGVYAFLRIRIYRPILDQRLSARWRIAVSVRSPELIDLAYMARDRRLMTARACHVVVSGSKAVFYLFSFFEYRLVIEE